MSKQGSFKVSRINLENLNVNPDSQGNQPTWEQQRKEFDCIIENIYELRSEDKARLQNHVQELFQFMKNSSDAAKDQQLSNLGSVLNLLGTQLTRKSLSTKSDKDDVNLVNTREQLEGSVKDFEKEPEELRNRNNMYQQELTHIKDKLKVTAEKFTVANGLGLSKKASIEIINSRCSIEGEKSPLQHELEDLMTKKSSPESVIDQVNRYLETIQLEFDKACNQVQELKVREKEFEMNKREDPENLSFREKLNRFNQQKKEKSIILERKPSKLSHDSNDLAGSETNSPKILSIGDGDINHNPRRENEELKIVVDLLKQKIDRLERENKQMNEALVQKNGSSRKSSDKSEEQQSGPEYVRELKDKQKKLEAMIEDLQKKIELEKVAKNQIIELKKELELENYQLRKEKTKAPENNQPSQSQSATPTLENALKLEEKISDAQLSGEREEINLLLKEKEGFKAQVRHLTNAVNKLKHRSISLQEPLVESFEILGVIAGIEREIFKLKYENEAYQTEGEQNSKPIEEELNSEGKGTQSTSQMAGLNVETLSKLLLALDKVKPALNSYFIKLQESSSMSGSIRKKQNSISLERRSLPLFNLEKMDESQKFTPDSEPQDTRAPGIAIDAISEGGREVILSEIAENVTEKDLSENHNEHAEYFQFTRATIETLHKCLGGYLQQAQQASNSQEQVNQNMEELIEVDQTEELQCFLAHMKDSGVGEMLYILQRNRVLHEENVELKRNLKTLKHGGSVIVNKDGEYNDDDLSIGSPGSKGQSISYYKEDQNYGEDEQFSKSIVISEMDSGIQDTLDSPFMKKRNTQESDASKRLAKRSKTLEEALEAETKAKEDLCKIILEKSVEIEQLTLEKEEIQTKLMELEKTYQNILKECEATLVVCDELQETNIKLRKTSENADEEIKGLKKSNKQIQDLLAKAQDDLDAAKSEYQDLSEKYNQTQEISKQEEMEQETEKNAIQNEFQDIIARLQKEQDELTEECKTLLLKYNELQEENMQLAESNKKFVQEVQSHLESSDKAQEVIKNLEKEKEELAYDCKELLAKYNQLQEAHNQLTETHANLDQEAQSHIESNKNIQEQILTLQKEKESFKTEVEALSAAHDKLQEEHAKLGEKHEISIKDIEHHLEKNKETEELIAKLEKEKEALGNDCKALLEKYSNLEEAHKQLDDAHANSKEEIQQHLDNHKNVQEQIEKLQKEKEDLKSESENLAMKYKQLEETNEQLNKAKQDLTQEATNLLQAKKDAQELIAKIDKEKETLSKDYEELSERFTHLEETYKLLSQSSTSSGEEVQRQLESNRQAQEQILKLRREKENVQAEMDNLTKKHEQLQEVHDQLNNSYKAVSEEATCHLENHRKAEELIANYEREKENQNSSHSELHEKLNKLQEAHAQLNKDNLASSEEIKQHVENNNKAQELITKLQKEQEQMRNESETLTDKHNKLQEAHSNLAKAQENSLLEIKQHLESIKLAHDSISRLQEEKEVMSRNHEISRADYDKLQEEHKKLKGTYENHLSNYNISQQLIEQLQNEKEGLSQDYNSLISEHYALQESNKQLSQVNQDHLNTHQTLQDLIVKLSSENEDLAKNLEIEKMRKSTPKSARGRHFPALNPIDEVEQNAYPQDETNIVLGTPVNKKVINLLDQLNSKIKTELKAKSNLALNEESDADNENVRTEKPKQNVERPKTMPKISYNILNWMADDALLVKKLCSLCDKDVRRDTQGEIKTVILELAQLNDGLKDYYTTCMEKSTDNMWGQLDFIQDLLTKCYEKQRALQPIQTKLVSHIEGLINARKTVK